MRRFTSLRSLFAASALAAGAFTLSSCDDKADDPTSTYAENAVLISNEGAMGHSNASVSYYNRNSGTLQNNIFQKQNNPLVLGDVLQSIGLHNDKAFLVMNNSRKIVVVNANTFVADGAIEGLSAPRYFAALNDSKAYVTEWLDYHPETFAYFNGRISVIDLTTLTVTKQITVGVQPEQLVISGGRLYVGHAGSDFVSVINTASDEVESQIPVTYGPSYLAIDRHNQLWALSSGSQPWNVDEDQHTAGALTKISMSTNTVSTTLTFASNTATTSKLAINGNKDKLVYGYDGKLYQHDVNSPALPTTALINRSFYGLGIDPASGYLYAGKAPSFTSDGWVVRFNPAGAAVDSFRVGVAPNGFTFR